MACEPAQGGGERARRGPIRPRAKPRSKNPQARADSGRGVDPRTHRHGRERGGAAVAHAGAGEVQRLQRLGACAVRQRARPGVREPLGGEGPGEGVCGCECAFGHRFMKRALGREVRGVPGGGVWKGEGGCGGCLPTPARQRQGHARGGDGAGGLSAEPRGAATGRVCGVAGRRAGGRGCAPSAKPSPRLAPPPNGRRTGPSVTNDRGAALGPAANKASRTAHRGFCAMLRCCRLGSLAISTTDRSGEGMGLS
jgi:hypothetical protein